MVVKKLNKYYTNMENWIEQLEPIILEYKDGNDELLSIDEVDELIHIIKAKINLKEGNITEVEYNTILDRGAKIEDNIERASHYLCDGDLSIEEQLVLIEDQWGKDGTVRLEDVSEDVIVWEAVVGRYSVDEFMEQIRY